VISRKIAVNTHDLIKILFLNMNSSFNVVRGGNERKGNNCSLMKEGEISSACSITPHPVNNETTRRITGRSPDSGLQQLSNAFPPIDN
jgi:hypothetical protein